MNRLAAMASILVVLGSLIAPVSWGLTAHQWFRKGDAAYKAGKYEEAVKCHSKALAIKPDFVEARYAKAVNCYMLKRYDEAEKDFEKLSRLKDPEVARRSLSYLGLMAARKKEYWLALIYFRSAYNIYPCAKYANNAFQAARKAGKYTDAIIFAKRAARLDPENRDALDYIRLTRQIATEKVSWDFILTTNMFSSPDDWDRVIKIDLLIWARRSDIITGMEKVMKKRQSVVKTVAASVAASEESGDGDPGGDLPIIENGPVSVKRIAMYRALKYHMSCRDLIKLCYLASYHLGLFSHDLDDMVSLLPESQILAIDVALGGLANRCELPPALLRRLVLHVDEVLGGYWERTGREAHRSAIRGLRKDLMIAFFRLGTGSDEPTYDGCAQRAELMMQKFVDYRVKYHGGAPSPDELLAFRERVINSCLMGLD